MAERVAVNPRVLVCAREERALSEAAAAAVLGISVEELRALESGKEKPTMTLFRKMAQKYDFQRATLAMPNPLPPLPTPKDFRTVGGQPAAVSPETTIAFEDALEAQRNVEELVEDDPSLYKPPTLDTATLATDPAELAATQRRKLNITVDAQLKWRDNYEAYRTIRSAIEYLGIFTFEKDMPFSDCRGFSVYLPSSVPIIVVSKQEGTPQAKTFTLLHEYAHLLLRDTGICNENNRNRVERFCNLFASNFLMPSSLIARTLAPYIAREHPVDRELVRNVAKTLKASQQAVALRLEELRYAPRGFYNRWVADIEQGEGEGRAQQRSGFATWERRKLSEYGRRYSTLAIEALQRRVLTKPEAFAMLDTTGRVFAKVRSTLFE